MHVAIDAMGGDAGSRAIVDGAMVAARHLNIGLILVGRADRLRADLDRHADGASLDVRVVETDDAVGMDESPAAALRRKPRASVRIAADLVASGDAGAMFSAGNTGATLLAAHSAFGLLSGVDRPALATTIPTLRQEAVLLDSGANATCRPQHLVQFAVMGSAYAQVALQVERPRIGLLSTGEEASKGNELTREAHRLLSAALPEFIGNVEGRQVYAGLADVVVCDGFTGNVALKVSEGLVEMVETLLRDELSRTFSTRVGYLLSRRAFRRFRKRVDYSEYGGAPLLGVAGLCVVGHGRSSAKAVRNAVVMASRLADARIVERLGERLAAG
jgi:glycerol-3-phosphate acyltransferase PlsX